MLLPSALGFSPHPPVSVYGTGTLQTIAAFLGAGSPLFATLFRSASRVLFLRGFCLPDHRTLAPGFPFPARGLPPRPHSSVIRQYRNFNLLSISYAFQILFGIELGATGKFSIMLCFILTYIISTSTGLARGMRYLSESNGYITLGLLFAVLILGATPFTYVINMLMQVAGEFLFRLPQNLLWTDAGNFEPREWSGSWFIFYILWNISYVPFTGGFIARISRGRTMREFVCGTVLVPLFMTLLWFSVWGSNSCYEQLKGFLPLWETVQGSPEQALYILLGSFPFGSVLCFIAFICFCLFAITTADAASHFIAQQTTNGIEVPRLTMRVFWGCTIGFTGILFQVTGGFAAIKSLAIAAAAPFVLVTFAYIISIVKMMKHDRQQEETE